MVRARSQLFHKLADQMLITGRVPSGFPDDEASLDLDTKSTHKSEIERGGLSAIRGLTIPVMVSEVLLNAISAGASDIHIEPARDLTLIRIRIDGHLRAIGDLSPSISLEFLSRLKVLCNMDIAEKRRPQDGRFRFEEDGRCVDIRVSTIPTESGEKMVLRLLDQNEFSLDIDRLGINAEDVDVIRTAIKKPQGMILVTGPTGSGKTTTLYSFLQCIRDPRLNVVTIEDPIEYRLDGVNQSQAKPDIGYTFANALRAFLRQDPNVIMVGEIRDAETTQIALRAAMTGHLVLSTVHTNDAASTITRLLDFGAEPFLVASSLSLVIAQRLVRCLCQECRCVSSDGPIGTFVAQGCTKCGMTGYSGRVGVFEVLHISPTVQELIHSRAPAERIRIIARQNGMSPLAEAARQKWLNGLTTLDELDREIVDIAPLTG